MPESLDARTLARTCALFDQCVDLPAAAQAMLLQELQAEPAVLVVLKAMLEADQRGDDLFATPASVWAAQLESSPETLDGLIGQTIGEFRIAARLGQGGSSVVFAAEREVAGATQPVALKLMRTGLFSDAAQRRFRREQAILAQLTHPHIARLIAAGVSSAGIPYIAMERIDGRPLLDDARARQLDLPARLGLLVTVAMAVDAAHRALIVHRDLKPSNILVDRDGQVKVLDFGIAKLIDDAEPTETQHIALTPGYAAPEQYRSGMVTTAVDVYALGVIGAELILDARLGPDASLPRGPDAPTQRRRWQALDADLATVLRTALAEDPAKRYRSARDFADDLGRYLRREPIAAHPPSRAYRARKFISRHRVAMSVVATMLVTVFLAFGVVLTQRDLARKQAARADSMRDFMFAVFADAEPGAARAQPVTVLEAVQRALTSSNTDQQMDPAARLELRLRLAQLLQRQGDLDGAQRLFQEVQDAATKQSGANSALALEAAIASVQNSMARGDFANARTQLEQVPTASDAEQRVAQLSLSAVLAARVRDLDRALQDGSAALVLARSSGDPELVRVALNDWGVVLLAADRVDAAKAAYQELLMLNRARFGERHQRVANVQAALARVYRRQGDLDRAEASARAAVAIDREVYAKDDRHAAVNLNALMLVLRERGNYEAALPIAKEALRINITALGEHHPDTALARYGVGDLLVAQEDYQAALPFLADSVRDNERAFGAAHWRTAAARTQYGYALGMANSASAGAAQMEQAIRDLHALPDGDLDRLCASLEKRARLAQHARDFGSAAEWLDQLASADPDATPKRACFIGNVELRRAAVASADGRHADAKSALQRAGVALENAGAPAVLITEHALLEALLQGDGSAPNASPATIRAQALYAALPWPTKSLQRLAAQLRQQ